MDAAAARLDRVDLSADPEVHLEGHATVLAGQRGPRRCHDHHGDPDGQNHRDTHEAPHGVPSYAGSDFVAVAYTCATEPSNAVAHPGRWIGRVAAWAGLSRGSQAEPLEI